jgi:hypothetical protein
VTDKKIRLNSKLKGFRVTSPPALWNVNGRENTLDECEDKTKSRTASFATRCRPTTLFGPRPLIRPAFLPQWMLLASVYRYRSCFTDFRTSRRSLTRRNLWYGKNAENRSRPRYPSHHCHLGRRMLTNTDLVGGAPFLKLVFSAFFGDARFAFRPRQRSVRQCSTPFLANAELRSWNRIDCGLILRWSLCF